jgi:hypothetical protein
MSSEGNRFGQPYLSGILGEPKKSTGKRVLAAEEDLARTLGDLPPDPPTFPRPLGPDPVATLLGIAASYHPFASTVRWDRFLPAGTGVEVEPGTFVLATDAYQQLHRELDRLGHEEQTRNLGRPHRDG